MKSERLGKTLKNIGITLLFPIVMLILMELVSLTQNTHIIVSSLDIQNLIRQTGVTTLIACALSFNLTCGRMDLSLGAQRLIGVIIGGNIAMKLGFNGIGLLIFAFLFGLVFGAVTGFAFVITKVPAMVLGIGVGLVYEAIAFIATDGVGLNIFGVQGMNILTSELFNVSVVVIFVLLIMYVLEYTTYGYHLRAIQGSQRISKAAGINVYLNAILSYSFAGGAVCVAGILDAAINNGMPCATGFTSNGSTMSNLFPMFLGLYLARWSNQPIGILAASLTLKIFALGLVRLNLNSSMTNVVTMALFLLFLIFLANENSGKVKRAEKARIAMAEEKKKLLAAA